MILHVLSLKALDDSTMADSLRSALVIISRRAERLKKAGHAASFCALQFEDLLDAADPRAIKQEHAKLIADFILEKENDIDDLYICSDSGTSRSAAVAAAYLRYKGSSEAPVWDNPYYVPNMLVYMRMCEAFGIVVTAEEAAALRIRNEQAYIKAKESSGRESYDRWGEIYI